MLDFNQVKTYFEPQLVAANPKGILVEYLQYELLDSIFKQPEAAEISFIGGTAIRVVHGSCRFSEDLDFDNFGLDYKAFQGMLGRAIAELKLKDVKTEARFLAKGKHYHTYLRFPDLLFELGLSGHRGEKIFLSVDAEYKEKLFQTAIYPLNKFGIFRSLVVDPPPVLLAQKLLAILFRKRAKGRDFYDASFLAGKTKADYNYLEKITGLSRQDFSDKITRHCRKLNFKALAKEVEPFLFEAEQKERVQNFNQQLPAILS